MEIDKKQIARLVLGYLKSENCKSAFNEFLIKSKYLKSYAVFVKNGKYFATRVGGLTLEEILSEYSDIALIIQGRLEQTNYYDKGLKLRLPEQLTYILENESRSSSPSLSKDFDATPVDSLPGNLSNDCSKSPNSSIDKSNGSSLHMTPGKNETNNLSQKVERSMQELDNQIRAIKQKAEKDPVFDKLLDEIIGQKNEISRECNTVDKNLTAKIQGSSNVQTSEANQNCSSNTNTTRSQQMPLNTISLAQPDPCVLKPMPDQTNQIFFANSGGLLMVPSIGGGSKYILVNNPPPNPTPLNNIVTETDIMRMPTLILEDAAHQSKLTGPQPQLLIKQTPVTQSQIIITSKPQVMTGTQKSTVSTCTAQHNKQMKTLKPLAPKTDKITIATSDGDYYDVLGQPTSTQDSNQDRPGVRTRSSRLSTKAETSPRKEASNPSPEKKKKSAKSLFKENKKGKEPSGCAWDAELRELLVPKEPVEEQMDTSDPRLEISINDEELQREAMIIEAAFKTPVKTDPAANKSQFEKKESAGDKEVSESEEKSENSGKSGKSEESEDAILTEQTEVHLRNCNGPPRIKKKCNLTDNPEMFEIVEIIEEDESPLVVKDEKEQRRPNLETPQKEGFPKTPGKFEMTPFTKALEEQLMGMDLLSLPTPSVVTPSFPITPSVHLTPEQHSNRPTDYSTSSSYYQPSDTEQNKSLEAVMEELKNKDKGKNTPTESKKENAAEIKSIFNKNVIGMKNLNLMKKEDTSGSESDSYSGSDWSGESSSDSETDLETTARKVKSPYSFRKRITKTPKQDDDSKETTQQAAKKEKTVKKSSVKGNKKKVETKISNELEKCDNENEITDDDFALHLSTDEDSTNKVNNDVIATRSKEVESASLPKEQAQTEGSNSQLIQDLFDRGIHLLPKVQAKRTSDSSSEANSNPNALENLVVSSEENSLIEMEKEDVDLANSTVNNEDVTFDCVNSEESKTIKLVYDSSKRRKKKVYDLSVLERKIEATVYVESLDADVKKMLTFTPTITILDCSPKKVPAKRKRPDPKQKTKKDEKPTTKPEHGEASVEKDTPTTSNKNEESSRRKSISRRSSRSTSERCIKLETTQKNEDSDRGKVDLVDLTIESGNTEKQDDHKLKKDKDDDDLMDFAVLGEKVESEEKAEGKSREKRKLSVDAESVPPEKRTKTETEKQALLKNINVDLFLNEVHGGGQRPK